MNSGTKKVLMIVAGRDFRDEECFVPKKILEDGGIEVKIASDKKGEAIGAEGGEIAVDLSLNEADASNFDAIIFIGGPGALKHLDNENSYCLAREATGKGKIVAAICVAPAILAKAGVLSGKKATVWTSPTHREMAKVLTENGARYVDENVVVDGKMITANGPSAAGKFGEEVLRVVIV
jgi:protease I